MPAPLPPPPGPFQRLRRRWQPADAWARLQGLPPAAAAREAWRLAKAGVTPSPSLELPVPEAWLQTQAWPRCALPADAPEAALAATGGAPEPGELPGDDGAWEHWLPWGWAWRHHPRGLAWLVNAARATVRAGHVPGLAALALAWPSTPDGRQAWAELEASIWARPACPAPGDAWLERGDWRHTLALWRVWRDRPGTLPAWPVPPPSHTLGYQGTDPGRWRWRESQFAAWQSLGLPPPPLALALRLAGLELALPGPWMGWLREAFDPPRSSCHQATERAAQTTWDRLIDWCPPSPGPTASAARAWLGSLRGSSPGDPARPSSWLEVEEAWARRFASVSPPEGEAPAWLAAALDNPALPWIGLDALATLPWERWEPTVFTAPHDGLVAWERCQQTLGRHAKDWPPAERMEANRVRAWLRGKALAAALEGGGPPRHASRL